MPFVNLHAHSHYSLLDGFGSPKDIVLRAKELGYNAAGLTDHGVIYGLIEFYQAAKDAGIKPILGCEMYVAQRTRFDKEAKIDVKPYHLTIFAKTNEGYKNLLHLVTKAHLEGFYYKPRVDLGLLKVYGKGLIALSGCLAANLPRAILSGNEDEVHDVIKKHIEIFGQENYFLEVQDHPLIEHQTIVNERLRDLAKQYNLGLVATNDSHYPRPEDSEVHDIMLCIQTQTTVQNENRMHYIGDYSIRDEKDLSIAFKDYPNAIENTEKIAEMCNVDFEFGKNLIPSFQTPQNEKFDEYLKKLCEEGLSKRFGDRDIPDDYKKRLEYELKVVNGMGFETYFLIVSDFVRYAKSKGITVGPGRGSAAGSIIAWSLDITDVDPIGYGLFFERFLNPERVSMPDIDIDFADDRRDEVLEYVIEKYGRDNVSQIITFGTMAPKAAIKDVGRVLGYPYQEVDKIAKLVPSPILGKYSPLIESLENDPDLRKTYESDPRAKVLLNYAKKIEGTVRQIGTHACAVVISEKPLTEYTALQMSASGKDEIVTQYSAKPIENLGLLKMDFLGLRNLTVIQKTKEFVLERTGEKVVMDEISLEDKDTFDLLQKGDTTGVFQLESAGMRRYLKDLKPTKFEDIVAMGALYRPGPMEWIPDYIKGKHNPEKVHYMHPSFKSVLESTYGVAVYQEQILQLARDFAGFTFGEADILRKAVGKKSTSLLMEQREKFTQGAVKNGYNEKLAKDVFEHVIEPFAGYGFNRAHAVCYGLIAYETAYLKAHYPIEFMTALLCSDPGNTDRVVLEIKECNEMGINVLPPSVNESFAHFAVDEKNQIRFGMLAIKGIGDGPVKEIIEAREKGGKFKNLVDFTKRVSAHVFNKKLIESLALSGAMDEFGDRKQIAENYEEISKYAKAAQQISSGNQTNIFGMMDASEQIEPEITMKSVPKSTSFECLKWEKQLLGMYVSGHPLRGLKKYLAKKAHLIGEITPKQLKNKVIVIGLISGIRKILTKGGTYMATFVIEDSTGKINAIIFPKTLSGYGQFLSEDGILEISGALDFRQGQYQISCDCIKVLSLEAMIKNAKSSKVFDADDKSGLGVRFLDDILSDKEIKNEVDSAKIEDFSLDDVKPAKIPIENKIYLIKIENQADKDMLGNLKNLLFDHKGDTPVEILLNVAKKRIKLPFGINLTPDLQKRVESLLTSEK